jgi:hypothetical protein
MTASGEPAGRPVATALRRPPVRQATVVRASAQDTFAAFVTTMHAWWPVQPLSAGKDRVRDITVQQRQGGRGRAQPPAGDRAASRPQELSPAAAGALWTFVIEDNDGRSGDEQRAGRQQGTVPAPL